MIKRPKCHKRKCIHFGGVKRLKSSEESEVVFCSAFPEGIPEDIIDGDNLHTDPVKGDNGIQYEEAKA